MLEESVYAEGHADSDQSRDGEAKDIAHAVIEAGSAEVEPRLQVFLQQPEVYRSQGEGNYQDKANL